MTRLLLALATVLCCASPAPTHRVVRPRAIAYLGEWGKRKQGMGWGIVAIPDSGWQAGDTLVLLTDRAKLEARP
jgi:hypothetical protein